MILKGLILSCLMLLGQYTPSGVHFPIAGSPGIAFVQYKTNSQDAGCTACAATAMTVSAGDGLLICFEYQSGTNTFTNFTSSPSTTWTTIGSGGSDAPNTTQLICGQGIAPSSGSITITANVTSFTFLSTVQEAEYSGTPSSGSILDTASTYLVSNGNPACPSVTTTVANDYVLCMMVQDTGNSGNFTAGSGYTLRNTASANMGWEDALQATTSTVTPTFTSTNVGGVIMVTLAVKP